ncbi:MAG: hypothetical protein II703_07055 [Ruminococcus sp.]|nr:hypothetical protein [Ruminococcus sp.]
MGKKCKICGYRFKSKDEAICPECFTARDDDISCERYSASEHSHGRSFSAGLRDTGESFVQRELREERRNSFARENFGSRANAGLDLSDFNNRYDQSRFVRNDYYENDKSLSSLYNQPQQPQQPQQQSAYQRYISQQQRKGYNPPPSSQTNSGSGFTNAGQVFAQRNSVPLQQAVYQRYTAANTGKPKKKNSAAATTFLIFFIFIFVTAVVISQIRDRYEQNRNDPAYTVTQQTQRTQRTTTARTTKQTTTTAAKTKANTTMGNYSCEILSCTRTPKKTSEISKDLLKWSSDFSKMEDPWVEVTIKVRIYKGASYTDIQKDPTVNNATLQCLEKAKAVDSLSYSFIPVNEKIELTDSGTEMTFTLLGHKDTKLMYFSLSIKGAGDKESCRFNINVE